MKKLALLLAISFTICFVLVSCASGDDTVISTIPWPDEEETRYTIQNRTGDTIGNGTLTIVKEGKTYILGQYWEIGEVKQTISLKVASDNLKPISEQQTILSPQGEIKIDTTYAGNKLNIEAETPQGAQTAEIDVPADAYDNDEVLFLYRALPFKEGYQATYTNVVASTAQKPKVTITITGKEQVEVPAGTFDCWKLEFQVARQKQYMWYGVDGPYYLVKYDNGQNIILLQEIVE